MEDEPEWVKRWRRNAKKDLWEVVSDYVEREQIVLPQDAPLDFWNYHLVDDMWVEVEDFNKISLRDFCLFHDLI